MKIGLCVKAGRGRPRVALEIRDDSRRLLTRAAPYSSVFGAATVRERRTTPLISIALAASAQPRGFPREESCVSGLQPGHIAIAAGRTILRLCCRTTAGSCRHMRFS